MALPPPKHKKMGAFYLIFGPMELSAGLGYTTPGDSFTAPHATAIFPSITAPFFMVRRQQWG